VPKLNESELKWPTLYERQAHSNGVSLQKLPRFSAKIHKYPKPRARLLNNEHLSHLYFSYLSPGFTPSGYKNTIE
jgi:hypothetical protein